jgi:polar amino acid transport system permease protein
MREDSNRSLMSRDTITLQLSRLPWWLLVAVVLWSYFLFAIFTDETYSDIFDFLRDGILTTIEVTLTAYAFAIVIGLMMGLGRVSKNVIIYNVATFYVQLMRGIPILVTLLYVSFVLVPLVINGFNDFGAWLAEIGLLGADNIFNTIQNRDVDLQTRGTIALALSYGAFSAEIFRAGIESIGRGQMEAARSLGMNYFQAMRYIILPQAIRRVLPPFGNDFIAMLKESSLISALGVRDITRLGTLYAASSFEYLATYNVVAYFYLTMTVLLSLVVKGMERRLKIDG